MTNTTSSCNDFKLNVLIMATCSCNGHNKLLGIGFEKNELLLIRFKFKDTLTNGYTQNDGTDNIYLCFYSRTQYELYLETIKIQEVGIHHV